VRLISQRIPSKQLSKQLSTNKEDKRCKFKLKQ
jgi:hypothetical protein